jgi:hypothetical protein
MINPTPFTGTPKENLRAMRILSAALATGASLFAIICIVMDKLKQDDEAAPMKKYEAIFLAISIGAAFICFLSALANYKRGLAIAKGSLISLDERLNLYREALIRYLALCEIPTLLAIIFFFFAGYYYLLLVRAAMIVAMLTKWPSKNRVITDLELDWKQQQELE